MQPGTLIQVQSDASELLKDSEQLSSYAEDQGAQLAILWKSHNGPYPETRQSKKQFAQREK